MRLSRAITDWLFERLGLDTALTGDLREERERGRSAIWYWRQVLVAIWVGIWGAISDHKLLALRAIVTGCGVNSVLFFLWSKFLHLGLSLTPEISIESMACLSMILLTQSVTGWVVARAHRTHPVAMVMVFAVWLVSWFVYANFSQLSMFLVDSVTQTGLRQMYLVDLVWCALPEFATVMGLLIGATFEARSKRQLASADEDDIPTSS